MTSMSCAWLALAGLAVGVGAAHAESDSPAPAALRRAFVTSTSYNGNLGGLAGADAKCQERAAAAGLVTDTSFLAFLSDSTTDAYCHVQGLTGKRSANCGLAELPAMAGPWVRVDGFPFADRIDLALAPTGRVLAPLVLDEAGAQVAAGVLAWTGSNESGAVNASFPVPCTDWVSNSGSAYAQVGAAWATTVTWGSYSGWECSSLNRLICLELGPASPMPAHRSGGALAFVTSANGMAKLGDWPGSGGATGVDAGDAICRALATAANLPAPDTFVAWLSSGAVHAIDRLTLDGPWIRLDGVRVAASKDDLVDGTLTSPINQAETGAYFSNYDIWTGTQVSGLAHTQHCDGWTLADPSAGQAGWANHANSRWTVLEPAICSWNWLHLYCLSNFPAVVFVDDFESGGPTAWSLHLPAH